jgi:hypothetical protein
MSASSAINSLRRSTDSAYCSFCGRGVAETASTIAIELAARFATTRGGALEMITTMAKQPFNACTDLRALVQGAPSRLRVATVVPSAIGAALVQGAHMVDVKYGGQGSRAWSPPV